MGKTIAAGIFILNKDKEVLICHPTNHPWDIWSIPKGKVEADEKFIEAAIRETFEETNIDLKNASVFHRLQTQVYRHKKKELNAFLFLEEENPNIDLFVFKLKCNSNVPEERGGFPEMDAYEWTDIETAKKYLHPTQVAGLEEIQKIIMDL
jgi:8-oxo-dGTP pyrophosphatase MutT (NUDIX family)